MLDLDLARPELAHRARDLIRNDHRAMASTGAAECDAQARLLLRLVARQREAKEWHDVTEELLGRGVSKHIVAHRLVAASEIDRKSTRLNSSHLGISYAVFCLKKKTTYN